MDSGNKASFPWTKKQKHAGCAAKLNPIKLTEILSDQSITIPFPSNLLLTSNWEDVGTFALSLDQTAVMNVDMISTILDDPYVFGEIAAVHALSDLYAKSAQPLFAMNILAYPANAPSEFAREMLKGLRGKLDEANCALLGGHTIDDDEPKLGVAVIGLLAADDFVHNSTCKVGDQLVLTKPLGTGIVASALRNVPEKVSRLTLSQVTESMRALNQPAALSMRRIKVNACTDITGFGLAGHLFIMLKSSDLSAQLFLEKIPVFSGIFELIDLGIYPPNLHHNMDFLTIFNDTIEIQDKKLLDSAMYSVCFDPQTSGGLLISVPEAQCSTLVSVLADSGVDPVVIGEIIQKKDASKIYMI